MQQHIDKVVAAIRATRERPAPADPVMAIAMAANGIDGPGLARLQLTTLEAWAVDPTLSEADRAYAAAQLAALEQ